MRLAPHILGHSLHEERMLHNSLPRFFNSPLLWSLRYAGSNPDFDPLLSELPDRALDFREPALLSPLQALKIKNGVTSDRTAVRHLRINSPLFV